MPNRIRSVCKSFASCFSSGLFSNQFLFVVILGTGGPTVVTEGKDALLTCVITGSFMNDTVLWRRGNNEILAAGTNRVTTDRRFRVLHDESMYSKTFQLPNLLTSYNVHAHPLSRATVEWNSIQFNYVRSRQFTSCYCFLFVLFNSAQRQNTKRWRCMGSIDHRHKTQRLRLVHMRGDEMHFGLHHCCSFTPFMLRMRIHAIICCTNHFSHFVFFSCIWFPFLRTLYMHITGEHESASQKFSLVEG